MNVDESALDDTVFVKEGSELFAEGLDGEMAMIPEPDESEGDVKEEDIQVGDPSVNTPAEIARMRAIIWSRRHICMGKGNALPPAAKGAICDIDVGGARPIAQKARKLPHELAEKVFTLLKGLLGARIIEVSESQWASPIVVVLKKNGVDIRLCIDYCAVNELTKLMV